MDLKGRKILIISPHPDDEAISTGGFIAHAREQDAEVYVLFVAIGLCRQLVTGETQPNLRKIEMENASKFCGYKYKLLFEDKMCTVDSMHQKQLIDPIEDYIAEVKPDIIIIPPVNSYDQDHRAVAQACITALRPVPQNIRHFIPLVLEFEEPYSWVADDKLKKPNFYLPLTEEQINFKIEALRQHATQLRQDPYSRSPDNITRLAKLRGAEIGAYCAEAYIVHRFLLK